MFTDEFIRQLVEDTWPFIITCTKDGKTSAVIDLPEGEKIIITKNGGEKYEILIVANGENMVEILDAAFDYYKTK